MDRHDESKHVRNEEDEERDRARDERTPDAPGSVLGLGGSRVPKMPGDPSAAKDEAAGRSSVRNVEDGSRLSGSDDVKQSSGATGIDMGAGGTGTEIDRE